MAFTIRTIEDMERLYYGSGAKFITKSDDPILSATTGVYNAIYGAQVWAILNQEANVFGVLPKYPWDRSGWRLQESRAGVTADGGVAEAGLLPETLKPDWREVTTKPKTVAHTFEVSEIQQFLTEADDAIGDLEMMRGVMGVKHKEAVNQQLLKDVEAEAAAATGDYAGTTAFETIDRAISSDSEEDVFGGTHGNYYDIYGLNRDTGTTYDSYVDHASGTDRDLSDEIVRNAIWGIKEIGGNPTVLVTGYDTYPALIGLYTDVVRYNVLGETQVSVGVNGIQTEAGINFGTRVATLYGLPVIVSKDVPKDTISRIYCLDTSDPEGFGKPRIGLMIARPTQYFESGIDKGDPFPIGKFTTKGMYRTMGELIMRAPNTQGKIRDLK